MKQQYILRPVYEPDTGEHKGFSLNDAIVFIFDKKKEAPMNDKEPTWAVFDDPNESANVCLCISYKGRDTVFSLPREDMYKMGETLVEFTHKGIALPRTVCRDSQS